jgi:hypothetical protein
MDGYLPDLQQRFQKLLTKGWRTVLAWLRFQFDDPVLANIFLDGGSTHADLERMIPSIEPLKALRTTEGLRDLVAPRGFRPLPASLQDPAVLGLAYAFYAFVKGKLYAFDLPTGAEHHAHWLRKTANDSIATEPGEEAQLFPWGEFIAVLCAPERNAHIDVPAALARLGDYSTAHARFLLELSQTNVPTEQIVSFVRRGLAAAALPAEDALVTHILQSRVSLGGRYRRELVRMVPHASSALGSSPVTSFWRPSGATVLQAT